MKHPELPDENLTVGINDDKVVLLESDNVETETAWLASDVWVSCGVGEPWDERIQTAVTGQ